MRLWPFGKARRKKQAARDEYLAAYKANRAHYLSGREGGIGPGGKRVRRTPKPFTFDAYGTPVLRKRRRRRRGERRVRT